MTTIQFFVPGVPKPAGSKRSIPIYRGPRDGSAPRVWTGQTVVLDDNKDSKDWKASVSHAARAAYSGPLLKCALSVCFEYVIRRPMGHWGSGRNADKLKESAPAYPIVKPDVLKLSRAMEDALTGILYQDDALIVQEVLRKDYARSKETPIGVTVTITALEALPVETEQKELIPDDGMKLLA